MGAAHTATPWTLRQDGHAYNGQSIEAECMGRGYYAGIAHTTQRDPHPTLGGGIDQAMAEANAAFIVRACNAHDDLVKALQVVRKLIDGSQPKDLPGAIMVIDAALAKVGAA